MTAENFNKMALIDNIRVIPLKANIPNAKHIGGFSYMEDSHCKVKISMISEVYQYPDHYKVKSRNFNPIEDRYGFEVDVKTEEEAYDLLYKIFYMPDSITYHDLHPYEIQEGNWDELSPEEKDEIRNDLKELDKQIAEADDMTKGEKFFYKILRGITKLVGM